MIDHSIIQQQELLLSNFERCKYLLEQFKSIRTCIHQIPVDVSNAALRIFSLYCSRSTTFTAEERQIMDECGYLFLAAIERALCQIKEMHTNQSKTIYCVLYEKYCNPTYFSDDLAIIRHMASYELHIDVQQFNRYVELGISMLAALLFQTPQQSAVLAYYHYLERNVG